MLRPAARCLSAGGLVAILSNKKLYAQRESIWKLPTSFASHAATKCEETAHTPWSGKGDVFKPDFRGQFTPSRGLHPNDVDGSAPVVELQAGPFKSRWLRVRKGATVDHVRKMLDEAEEGAMSAIYVGIPDDHDESGKIVAALREHGFRFHHMHDGSLKEFSNMPAGELIYYRWVAKRADMVPPYSTASEGVGVCVVSPDKESILLVWEYGHWKMVTGTVEPKSNFTETVRKEVMEEVGLELEDSMQLIGGYQETKTRDRCVSNVFLTFAAVAKSKDFKLDNMEIHQARWFPLSSIPTVEDEKKAKSFPKRPHTMEVDFGLTNQNVLSRTVCHFVDAYRQGRGLHVKHWGSDRAQRDLFC
eukprot:TRINITY_DN26289_c0_g1_i1.p1 TRINITY_DN26289_c0_g1~~TRINITY_DN26289_c0_g1_i1.p1  ORF type:complete len:360 (+),score=29.38 TRINITY_DN26289_c0_g1_i1:33-1112(+)